MGLIQFFDRTPHKRQVGGGIIIEFAIDEIEVEIEDIDEVEVEIEEV